jgi:hypothetical protein
MQRDRVEQPIELGLFTSLSSLGLVLPNAVALALDGQGSRAGNAAAWLGALQWGAAATTSAVVATLANGTAVPTAATMLATAAMACALRWWDGAQAEMTTGPGRTPSRTAAGARPIAAARIVPAGRMI